MAVVVASITPSSGFAIGYTLDSTRTASGGQSAKIIGTGLANVNSVLIDGRAALIISKAATEVNLKMPYRQTDGAVNWADGPVDVVVSDGVTSATLVGGYTYKTTRLQKVVHSIESRAALASTATGYVFDYSPAQVIPVKIAPGSEDAGQAWPHVQIYTITASEDRAARTEDGITWIVEGTMLVYKPLSGMENIEHEQDLMIHDAIKVLMSDTGNSGTTDNMIVTTFDKGSIDGGAAAGMLGAVFVNFRFDLRHIWNDPTSIIQWNSSQ